MDGLRRHLPLLRQAGLQAFRAATFLLVCGYLGLVLLHVLPENPLQAQLEPLNRQVVGAYFKQGWGMFAPGPPMASWTVLARCHGAQGPSPWIDLTTERTRSPRWNPFSMDLRLVSYLHEALRADEFMREREEKAKESPPSEEAKARHEKHRAALRMRWARIGSLACADALGERASSRVELKYVQQELARWSTRNAPRPPPEEHEIGSFEVLQEPLARPGLFHAEVTP